MAAFVVSNVAKKAVTDAAGTGHRRAKETNPTFRKGRRPLQGFVQATSSRERFGRAISDQPAIGHHEATVIIIVVMPDL